MNSATFKEIETIRCSKCASGPGNKCWVMAGRGITTKTKLVPHLERAIAYFKTRNGTVKQLEAEPCRCVRCDACGGSGAIYFDIGGKYIGSSRIDDLCDPEPCDMCSGGIVEECDRCVALNDYDISD